MQVLFVLAGMLIGVVLYRWGYTDAKLKIPRDSVQTLLQQMEHYDGNVRKEGGKWKR